MKEKKFIIIKVYTDDVLTKTFTEKRVIINKSDSEYVRYTNICPVLRDNDDNRYIRIDYKKGCVK